MPKTRRDLVEQSLKHLGVVTGNETPSAEDYSLMDGFVEPTIADLNAREVAYDLSPDAIQDEHYLHLAMILAEKAIPDFGVQGDDANRLMMNAMKAENALFSIARTTRRKPRKLGFDDGLALASRYGSAYLPDA